ncbi:hypothetical protein PR048_009774 [Dryococelus australis]|uniref:Outer dynein arm-docking complex subunit 4 n=1 Tax=Dryococelus australis TaxID=614101 RepID=A0ABQ9I0U2_9NEOP|nr:hypothetical protein PR048_009774 [Dryococelus australis]
MGRSPEAVSLKKSLLSTLEGSEKVSDVLKVPIRTSLRRREVKKVKKMVTFGVVEEVEEPPEYIYPFTEEGKALFRRRLYDKCLEYLDKSLEVEPVDPLTLAWRSRQYGSLMLDSNHPSRQSVARDTVAERLVYSPPTEANRVQSPAGSLPDFVRRESCQAMSLLGGFSRGSPVSQLFHSSSAPCSPQSPSCQIHMFNPSAALADARKSKAMYRHYVAEELGGRGGEEVFSLGLLRKADALYHKARFEEALVLYHQGTRLRPGVRDFPRGVARAQQALLNSLGKWRRGRAEGPRPHSSKVGWSTCSRLSRVRARPLRSRSSARLPHCEFVNNSLLLGLNNFFQTDETSRWLQQGAESSSTPPKCPDVYRKGLKVLPHQRCYDVRTFPPDSSTREARGASGAAERCLMATTGNGFNLAHSGTFHTPLRYSRRLLNLPEPRFRRYDENTARHARRSDEALGVRVTVARIAPPLLDLGRAAT